ncbi:MAG: hypothetical protein KIH01_01995 [Candidatus Freyarchaeota archaeon]|nr:hypothetical protein [Candidatus Jordarchaeia archaeon]
MLQVDLLWVYAIGAMFATAAAKQLKRLEAEKERIKDVLMWPSPFGNVYFALLLLYLSVIFIPEAVWLTWNFPQWETMHVWSSLEEIPTHLVTLFMAGDVVLAVLGYWVAYKLIARGKEYLAHLQWIAGYFAFFLVLLHGWDGLAWQRFTWDSTVVFPLKMPASTVMLLLVMSEAAATFYPTLVSWWLYSLWVPGKTMAASFAASNIAVTLYAMAAPTIVPLLIGGYITLRDGHVKTGMSEAEAASLSLKGLLTYLLGVLVAFVLAGVTTTVSNLVTGITWYFWPVKAGEIVALTSTTATSIPLPVGFAVGIIVTAAITYFTTIREGSVVRKTFAKNFKL